MAKAFKIDSGDNARRLFNQETASIANNYLEPQSKPPNKH